MASGTVANPWITQIVERRRGAGAHAWAAAGVAVALQALQVHLGSVEEPGIGRTVRLMAGVATFLANRCVFEDKRAAQVAMALDAAWLVGAGGGLVAGESTTVRVVAIGATDGAVGESMLIGAEELGDGARVALAAVVGLFGRRVN